METNNKKMKDDFKAFIDNFQKAPEKMMQSYEKQSIDILREDGYSGNGENTSYLKYKPRSKKANDARKVLLNLLSMKKCINNKDARFAALWGVLAGEAAGMARLRPFEKDIIQHQKLKIPKKKHSDVTPSDKAAWQKLANGYWAKDLSRTKHNVAELISNKTERPTNTIRQHIKKPDGTS